MAEEKKGGAGKVVLIVLGVLVGLGVITCLVAALIIGGLTALGNNLERTFNEVADEVNEAN